MKRIRQGWNTLRRNKRSGVSLIVALCAVAVLIGLSLSIVYSSSMLLSRANRKIGRERCYQLAQSFAQVLDSELKAYNTDDKDLDAEDAVYPQPVDGSTTFYQYVNEILEDREEYDPDDPLTTYYYTVGSKDDDYGKITVMLRKKNIGEPLSDTGEFPYDERITWTTTIEHSTSLRYQLWVIAKVEKGADSFTYTTQYYREDSFEPIYTWQSDLQTIERVYWVNPYFSRSHSLEDKVLPEVSDNGEVEDVHISYRYDASKTTYKKYREVHTEAEVQSDE